MRLLFDLGHPADVHYFKYTIQHLKENGHSCFILARDKEVTTNLLKNLDLDFTNKGIGGTGIVDRVEYTIHSLVLIQNAIKEFRPDLCISHGSPYLAFLARVNKLPHIMFNDTEKAVFFKQVAKWFTPDIYVPDCFLTEDIPQLHRVPSYMELAYLHPDLFTPDKRVQKALGENYILLRFVSHSALHDAGSSLPGKEFKQLLINRLSSYGKVWISSENELPEDLQSFKYPLEPENMHHAIAGAKLVIGDSATMCAEAAVLGTPSVHIHKNRWGYLKELDERYGLLHHFPDTPDGEKEALSSALEMLNDKDHGKKIEKSRRLMLSEKRNMCKVMIETIEGKLETIAAKKEQFH